MEKEFVNGLIVKKPHEKTPDWVKCRMSIKREDLINWLQMRSDDWINLQVSESKDGSKWYAEVDNWKPEPQNQFNQPVNQNGGSYDKEVF